MEKLGLIFATAILGIGMIILSALITSIFIYLGWNYGIRVAVPNAKLGEISVVNAWCIGVFLSSIAGAFQSKVETKAN